MNRFCGTSCVCNSWNGPGRISWHPSRGVHLLRKALLHPSRSHHRVVAPCPAPKNRTLRPVQLPDLDNGYYFFARTQGQNLDWTIHGSATCTNHTLDLEIALPTSRACQTDNFEDALDYAFIVQRINETLSQRHFSLLEALAEHIAQIILTEFKSPWTKNQRGETQRDTRREKTGYMH